MASFSSSPDSNLPFSTNHRSRSTNFTWESGSVTFFVIQGLDNLEEQRLSVFIILLVGYIIILGGNTMIVFMVRSLRFDRCRSFVLTNVPCFMSLPFPLPLQTLLHPKLNSPMYFFLRNLSFVDVVYTTTTIPNMLAGFLKDRLTVSIPGCFLQMYFFIHFAVTGRGILTAMAYDRYLAICNPLRYTAIMTRPVQILLVAAAWGFALLCTLPATIMGVQRPYCGPNVVQHGWCDPSSVRRLVCAETSVDSIVSLSCALVALLVTGVLIITSYALIAVSVSRMGITERLKAFGTCAAHLTVVSISYSAASFVYISYRVGNFSSEVHCSCFGVVHVVKLQ